MTYRDKKDLPPRGDAWHDAFDAWHGAVALILAKAVQCLGLDGYVRSNDDTQDKNVYHRTRDHFLSTDPDVLDTTVVDFELQKTARHKQAMTCELMNYLESSDSLFSNDLSVILPDLNDSGTESTPKTIDLEVSGLFSEESDVFDQIPKSNDSLLE